MTEKTRLRQRLENYPLHESMRGYFGKSLYEQMAKNDRVFLLVGDLGYGLFDPHFADFPDRCINTGAAEQSLITIGVGLSVEGKIPVCYSITPFLLYRGFEVIRNYINGEKWPVILVGGGRDRDYIHDGPSHWAEEDKQVMALFPNIQSYWPETKEEIPKLLAQILASGKPTYLNLRR